MSCDLMASDTPGPHFKGDVFDVLEWDWDLMIAHPPCTYLTLSGVRWLYSKPNRWKDLIDGALFFRDLLLASHIPKVAVENPIMHGYASKIVGRKHDQVIQPWQFGHPESKGTALWLRGLPKLVPTNVVKEEMDALTPGERNRIAWVGPGEDRARLRSNTYPGIAAAMAEQWG